tara:strand:- start:55 stop:507 length:453 start_codon:yes stop_codon:yes gene_type:complete
MDYMKIKDRDKRIEFLNNTHLKKGQKFKLVGVEPSWDDMGITQQDWNWNNGFRDLDTEKYEGSNPCVVRHGKLTNNKMEEIIWEVPNDMTYSQLLDDWVECDWMDSPLYYLYGLLVEKEFQFSFDESNGLNKQMEDTIMGMLNNKLNEEV